MPQAVTLILLYFCFFGVYGVISPFAPIVLRGQGLDDQQINIALSTFGAAALFSPLLISHIADRYYSMRSIITKLLIVSTLLTPLWIVLHSFPAIVLFCLIYYAALVPALTLLDAFTIDYVRKAKEIDKRAHGYQYYRIWGSVGFIFPSLMLIPISARYNISADWLISLSIFLSFASVLLCRFLPNTPPQTKNVSIPSMDAISVATRAPLSGVFAATTIAGLALSIFYIALPRFLQELGNSNEAIGIIINLGVAAEILLMPFTADIVRRFGARTLILAGLWSIPARLLLVCHWPSTEMVVATQFLHAPLIVGLFVSVPVFLGQHAQDSFHYSLQGLNNALTLGLARIIGPVLIAIVLHLSILSVFEGLRLALFFAACLGALAFLVLFFSKDSAPSAV